MKVAVSCRMPPQAMRMAFRVGQTLPLHAGFASAWPRLLGVARKVDAS